MQRDINFAVSAVKRTWRSIWHSDGNLIYVFPVKIDSILYCQLHEDGTHHFRRPLHNRAGKRGNARSGFIVKRNDRAIRYTVIGVEQFTFGRIQIEYPLGCYAANDLDTRELVMNIIDLYDLDHTSPSG